MRYLYVQCEAIPGGELDWTAGVVRPDRRSPNGVTDAAYPADGSDWSEWWTPGDALPATPGADGARALSWHGVRPVGAWRPVPTYGPTDLPSRAWLAPLSA